MQLREVDTRAIPYAAWEYAWAHERPAEHRTPVPAVGDEVLYRHDAWGPAVSVEVVWKQPLDDLDDPHLWRVELDGLGNPLAVDGRPIFAQRIDPWPVLRLRVPRLGLGETREARLRGSPGWLPLDWEARFRPMPQFTIVGG
jgi:hypothetical protein